jgi:hypothetical protein
MGEMHSTSGKKSKTYEAETTFLYRSANVGNRKIVNIVYVPPLAAVKARRQNTPGRSAF